MIGKEINLNDDRICLEILNHHHLPSMIKYALLEPDTWQYSLVSPGGSAEAMNQYLEFALKEYEQGKAIPFAVIDIGTNQFIGSTRFYDIDFNNKIATIGYTWYGKMYRRTGINRRCKMLMLSYAFEQWEMERIEFRADINNTNSINAMKAIGCKEEGILRSHAKTENGRRTSMILSILKSEWLHEVKHYLKSKIIE